MPAFGLGPLGTVLPTCSGKCREPAADEIARPTLHRTSRRGRAAHDAAPAPTRARGEPKASAQTSASDGAGSVLSQAPPEHSRSGGGPLSLFAQGIEHHATGSSVERGYYLHRAARRLRVSGRNFISRRFS